MMEAIFLGVSPETIGSGPHVLYVDVALFMQVAQNPGEPVESFPDIPRLFVLGVRLVCNFYIEVETALPLFTKGLAANDPVVRIDIIDCDGGDLPFLPEDARRQIEKKFRYLSGQF